MEIIIGLSLVKIKNYIHFDLDIRNKFSLEKNFKKIKNLSGIINCAAQPSHDWARSNPEMDFEINSKATLNLLLLANIHKIHLYIFLLIKFMEIKLIMKISLKRKMIRNLKKINIMKMVLMKIYL